MVAHAYTEAGEYTVTLTVTDNDGLTDSTELSLEVKPIPVLLVHGYCSSTEMWGPNDGPLNFKQALEDQGFAVETIELLPKPTNDSIWNYGSQLFGKITQMRADYEVDQVDIVAHSLGGLAARAYAWQNSSLRDVRTLIMLGTPNNGSGLLSDRYWRFLRPVLTAHTLGFPPCQGFGEAAHQMTPGSPFLRDLNSAGLQPSIENYYTIAGDEPVPGFSWISNWLLIEPHDGVVEVASVQAIPGTTNYLYHVNHFEYDDDSNVFNAVVNILRGATVGAKSSVQVQQSTHDYQESALIEDSVATGEVNDHSIPIDSTVSEVRFALASSPDELDFTLTSPGGTLITPAVAASDPLITYTNAITTLIGYDVTGPEQGNWIAHVATPGTASSEVSYAMLVLLDSGLGLSILLDETVYHVNDPVPLTAQLMNASGPVAGATMVAQVESPDGSIQVLSLYDDGSHRDGQPNDGLYSNLYTNTTTTGAYETTVTASGMINSEQFVRETATTIWVECESIHGTAFDYVPPEPWAQQPITFTAAVSGGSPPLTYTWDFGDSHVGVGQLVPHCYEVGNDYTVTLTTTNVCSSGWFTDVVRATLRQDVDRDCDVDIVDIQRVASRWRCKCGDACYDPLYHLDGDCDIDIVDIMLVVAHWGETCG